MGRGRPWTARERQFVADNYSFLTAKQIGEKLGRCDKSVSIVAKNMGLHKRNKKPPETLCWDCAKSTNGKLCPWVNSFDPVPGWEAKEVERPEYFKSKDKSKWKPDYIVISCPEFVEG